MHRVYEIYEVLPNSSPHMVRVVSGLQNAKARLHELANSTRNECFAADARTRQIVAMANVPVSKWRSTRHIFQISYDEQMGLDRARLLKSRGYRVLSVIGNEAAKVALSSIQRYQYDLFVVGHAAPEETRQGMVLWLKAKFPKAKILALNPPNQELLRADYNARQNDPELWLSIISRELGNSIKDLGSISASSGDADTL